MIERGDKPGGLKELLEAAEMDPANPEIQLNIAIAYRDMKELDKAIRHLNKALELKPSYPEAQNEFGNIYAGMKDWDKALASFMKAAQNDMYTKRHIAYDNIGTVYYMKGHYMRALESYKKSIAISSRYSRAYDNMGLTYEALGQKQSAIRAYHQSIKLAPGYPESYLHLGRIYLQLNRQKEAVEALLKAIENDPSGTYGKEARKLLNQVTIIKKR